MKKIIFSMLLGLAALPLTTKATTSNRKDHHETRIIETKINYARALVADDRQGFSVRMAAIGGQVVFEGGHPPVYATLRIGGQIYTAPSDAQGYFSFFVYTNGYNEFTVEGWASHEAAPQPMKVTNGILH
jgi:hypothetical protein